MLTSQMHVTQGKYWVLQNLLNADQVYLFGFLFAMQSKCRYLTMQDTSQLVTITYGWTIKPLIPTTFMLWYVRCGKSATPHICLQYGLLRPFGQQHVSLQLQLTPARVNGAVPSQQLKQGGPYMGRHS